MSLDDMDDWDESFLQAAIASEAEALASRNLRTPTPYPPSSAPALPPASAPPYRDLALVRSDGGAGGASSGVNEIPFSPPRELSQVYATGRPRAGDDFFDVEGSWGEPWNTDPGRKSGRELERLKRELTRVSQQLNHKESECSELKRDRMKKEEQLKNAFEQLEAKENEIRNLKRANEEKMLSSTEHNPVLLRAPPTVIANGGSKVRKVALTSSRDDPVMASTPAVLESRHNIMNNITSTSKTIGVQTEYGQDGTLSNECSTTSKSLYEEQICSNLQATWGNKPANRRTRRELMLCVLASCSKDIFAPFDDKEMTEVGSSEDCSDIELIGSKTVSHLQALVMKVHNQTAEIHQLVEELLNLCRVKNVSLVARCLKILRTILLHLISFETISNERENVSVQPSPTHNKQDKRSRNRNNHAMDLCLLNEDANFDKMIDLPPVWWMAIFDAVRETITKSSKESLISDALLIMILVVMRSDVNTDRGKFGLASVIECVHLIFNKEVGPFVKKQAVCLLFLVLNCPKMLALLCSGGRDSMDVVSGKTEEQSVDVLQHQIGLLLQDLGECLSCPLSGSVELKLVRQVIILLAYIASYGKSGFEILLGPVGPTGLNLLELVVQVLSAQMNLGNNEERNLVMWEALILLNRLASNPIYSKTTLEVVTRSKSCASLTIDIANRVPRMGRCGPHTNSTHTNYTHTELEIAELARVFQSRVFSFIGER